MTELAGVSPSLWSRRQVLLTGGVFLLGVVLWVVAWLLLSGRPALPDQAGPATLGVGGAAVVLFAQSTWVLAGRRAVRARRRMLIGRPPAGPVRDAGGPSATDYVAGQGLRLYHRIDCPLVPPEAGRIEAKPVGHMSAGRLPCGVCRP